MVKPSSHDSRPHEKQCRRARFTFQFVMSIVLVPLIPKVIPLEADCSRFVQFPAERTTTRKILQREDLR